MVNTMVNPVLDPIGFRQLLNYLYNVRALSHTQDKLFTLTSTEIPDAHLVCPCFLKTSHKH